MKKNHFPAGWAEDKVRRVIKHYERQSAEEAALEDERAYKDQKQTFIEVPVELVPSVRKLLARHVG
ncbi:MAG: hypothetical protein JXA71_15835 [Chitinispirillaceae bacterium]|nr:hypothetical protein [Chitinispirillaceae bacterium]